MTDVSGIINYKGRDYKLVFNLNVMERIQSEYKSMDEWGSLTDGTAKGEPDAKAVIFGIAEMLNEGIDIENEENGTDVKPFTLKQVGRIITDVGLANVAKQMNQTVIDSTKTAEKN